jgi:hypothetical protein
MTQRTYHVALAFDADSDGELHAIDAAQTPTPHLAISRAKRLATRAKGAVAFSRTGDPDLGEYSDATVLMAIGELPADVRDYLGQTLRCR